MAAGLQEATGEVVAAEAQGTQVVVAAKVAVQVAMTASAMVVFAVALRVVRMVGQKEVVKEGVQAEVAVWEEMLAVAGLEAVEKAAM